MRPILRLLFRPFPFMALGSWTGTPYAGAGPPILWALFSALMVGAASAGEPPRLILDIDVTGDPLQDLDPRLIFVGGSLTVFAGDDGLHGEEPWITDGTAAGTRMILDLRPGTESSSPSDWAEVAGEIVFAADAGVEGRELWKT
ncbi:MAG: hypothetical protein MI919_18220, partial [Holophagales bacterium]|nr:hypothetical protein [Holophagales bacterium]